MSAGVVQVAPDSTGKKIDTSELTVGANTVERQRIVIGDDSSAAGLAPVDATNGLATYQPLLKGTWNYVASTLSGAGNVTGSGRCIGISVYAQTADGSFNINGGNTIAVRAGTGFSFSVQANLTAPVVTWVSGTLDIVVEGLT